MMGRTQSMTMFIVCKQCCGCNSNRGHGSTGQSRMCRVNITIDYCWFLIHQYERRQICPFQYKQMLVITFIIINIINVVVLFGNYRLTWGQHECEWSLRPPGDVWDRTWTKPRLSKYWNLERDLVCVCVERIDPEDWLLLQEGHWATSLVSTAYNNVWLTWTI